jgi:hypothetical protein
MILLRRFIGPGAALVPLLLLLGSTGIPAAFPAPSAPGHVVIAADPSAVSNFSAALQRLVTLLGLSGSALLAIVWARVALSWFSNDVTKKIQAKDRARDALVGTLLFTAAFTGLAWGLARWVLTGS